MMAMMFMAVLLFTRDLNNHLNKKQSKAIKYIDIFILISVEIK
jgi:hypothetical protein